MMSLNMWKIQAVLPNLTSTVKEVSLWDMRAE
jgi:hypothetical protein